MISLDRRTALVSGMAGVVATALPLHFASAAEPRPGLFLYDPRFARSAAEAQAWKAQGVRLLDIREHDLGRAWRDIVAPLVKAEGCTIGGRTLGSDRMISAIFAREHGCRLVEEAHPQGQPICETRAWRLIR